ncbi:MAG: isochorismatase family cysteine hydrolase [Candidatus Marinimicrobia bacterium]|nr:isochorismatase family cysteine hydrolase [Candidatus Neomarinimicrobiota bacterium]
MKETYFLPETIHQTAIEMRRLSVDSQHHRNRDFRPGEVALLVLDMQNYFFEPKSHAFIPSGPAVLENIKRLISAFNQHRRPVIFTRHINTAENAGMMARWWGDMIRESTEESELIAALKPMAEILIEKCQYDAFYKTDMVNILEERNVRQLVISGVMTHLCCETTARSAFMQGFEVYFPVDATITYNRRLHEAALLTLGHGFAEIPTVAEILELMDID